MKLGIKTFEKALVLSVQVGRPFLSGASVRGLEVAFYGLVCVLFRLVLGSFVFYCYVFCVWRWFRFFTFLALRLVSNFIAAAVVSHRQFFVSRLVLGLRLYGGFVFVLSYSGVSYDDPLLN